MRYDTVYEYLKDLDAWRQTFAGDPHPLSLGTIRRSDISLHRLASATGDVEAARADFATLCKRWYWGLGLAPLWPKKKKRPRRSYDGLRQRKQIGAKQRRLIFERDRFRCSICGADAKSGRRLEIDHILPVAAGGTNTSGNLRVLCQPCNSGKSNRLDPVLCAGQMMADEALERARFQGMARVAVEAFERAPTKTEPLSIVYHVPGRDRPLRRKLSRREVRMCRKLGTIPKIAAFLQEHR